MRSSDIKEHGADAVALEDGRPTRIVRSRAVATLLHLHAAVGKSMAYRANVVAFVESARLGAPCLLRLMNYAQHERQIIQPLCDNLTMAQQADLARLALADLLAVLQNEAPQNTPRFRMQVKAAIHPLRHMLAMAMSGPYMRFFMTEDMAVRLAARIWLGKRDSLPVSFARATMALIAPSMGAGGRSRLPTPRKAPADTGMVRTVGQATGGLDATEAALLAALEQTKLRMHETPPRDKGDADAAKRVEAHLHDLIMQIDAGGRATGPLAGEDRIAVFAALSAIHRSMKDIVERRCARTIDDLRTQVRFTLMAHEATN